MLVPFNEMRAYMGGLDFTAMEEAEMTNIINGVQQALELYLNRPVEPVQIRELASANFQGVIYTSVTPVLKVLSVTTDTTLPVYSNALVPPMERDSLLSADGRLVDKFQISTNEVITTPGGLYGTPFNQYFIEYIGGLQGYGIDAIKLGIKRVAAREWGSNHISTVGNRVGNAEYTQTGDSRFLGWAADELKAFDRYRRRMIMR